MCFIGAQKTAEFGNKSYVMEIRLTISSRVYAQSTAYSSLDVAQHHDGALAAVWLAVDVKRFTFK